MTGKIKPYALEVHWIDGRVTIQAEGHNPSEVRRAECQISRNARVIYKIVLVDSSGVLETIWNKHWV